MPLNLLSSGSPTASGRVFAYLNHDGPSFPSRTAIVLWLGTHFSTILAQNIGTETIIVKRTEKILLFFSNIYVIDFMRNKVIFYVC